MASHDASDALDAADVRAVVAGACFPEQPDTPHPGRVGLEVERFPVLHDRSGGPAGRVRIDAGIPNSLAVLDEAAGEPPLGARIDVAGVPSYPLAGGGRVTFEPGGVVEHATAAHDTAAGALAEVERAGVLLAEAFDAHGVTLASTGTDPWHEVGDIPLQLDCFRYPAMAAYFARRGSEGLVIMRHSASMQVNLDLGPPGEQAERWLLANLLSPLVTATFANSPSGDSVVAARSRAWQGLDPTRTGFPAALVDGSSNDPVEHMTSAALAADVLLVRTGPDRATPGTPEWTFAQWARDGHPEHGRPNTDDLRYHLSTLFHEVRPRGSLELRAVDALPHHWRAVPVVLLCGAVEDPTARGRLLDLLVPRRPELPSLWRRAADPGVADPSLCALAVEVWSFALDGAHRLPPGYLPDGAPARAEEFLERFTLRGRCPADELRQRLEAGPADALAWAAEPVPQRARGAR